MALMETKMVQVANDSSTVNETNNEWGSFGWSVLNLQITHTQDSKTYTKGLDFFTGDATVETTTINYATITYQRDKLMNNYSQIVQIEQQYLALKNEMNEKIERIIADDSEIDWFAVNPAKQLKGLKNLFKLTFSKPSISRKAQERCATIAKEYEPKLSNLRTQAETLLC